MIKRQKSSFQIKNFMMEGGVMDDEKEKARCTILMELFTMVNGKTINDMDLESLNSLTSLNFKVSLKKMNPQKQITKENQNSQIQKETSMKHSDQVIFMMESFLAMGKSCIQMEITMKVSLKTVKSLGMEN